MVKTFILVFLFFSSFPFYSQQITYSGAVEISVLTCGSGDELYSKFGHSAFRIRDKQNNLDVVYNYGVFDFSAPNFYTDFAKGKLTYKLGRSRYDYFYKLYLYENRSVQEQLLNLNTTQKKKLVAFLEHNALPENASYQYDFFYNNCATKIRAVLDTVLPNQINYSTKHITTNYTLRQLINNNVPYNTWGNVGINIALGSVIDVKATKNEYQFLPEYIYKAFNNAKINDAPLVKQVITRINKDPNRKHSSNFIGSPLFIFSILSLIIILISYFNFKTKKRSVILDFTLLLSTGIVGVLVLLLWFATNHQTTANNLNVLWAFAPNCIVAVALLGKKSRKWYGGYFAFLSLLMLILLIVWFVKATAFAVAMLPFFIALLVRYCYLYWYFKTTTVL